MPRKFTTKCPVCHKPMFKKNLTTQKEYITEIDKQGFKSKRTYTRTVCFSCKQTARWVVKDRFNEGKDLILVP